MLVSRFARAPAWRALPIPAVLLVLGLATCALASRVWTAFTRYQTPFAFANPDASSGTALADPVVIVLADGLTLSASRSMPFLNELRRRGGDADCRVGLPSLSQPGRAVLMSGAWSEVHGQTTNFNTRPLRVEHLFGVAKRKGLRTAYAGGARARRLFEPFVDHHVPYRTLGESERLEGYVARLGPTVAAGRRLLETKQPQLYFVDVSLMDQVGHGWGAASAEYARAAVLVDAELRKLAEAIDLSRGVLVVTSDHGHVSVGGHGGPEPDVMTVPLVMSGASIRTGARTTAEQVDVAPTVAALLGTEFPASGQGRVLFELLDLPAPERQVIEDRLAAQRRRFAASYLAWLGAAPDTGDPERALDLARRQRLAQERRTRGVHSAALAVATLLVLAAFLRLGVAAPREIAGVFVFAVLGVALYFALLSPLGIRYSMTAVNKDEWLKAFFGTDMALAVATCAVAAALAVAWRARRGPAPDRWEAARVSWLVAAAYCAVFLVKMAIVYWRHGVILEWSMPDQYWAFGFYLDALVVMAVGFLAPLIPLPALAAARFAERVAGHRSTRRAAGSAEWEPRH